jgi:hypothetical protein
MTDAELRAARELAKLADRFLSLHEGEIDPFSVVDQFAEAVCRLIAEADAMRPVVEAAGALRDAWEAADDCGRCRQPVLDGNQRADLREVIDAYRKGKP